MTQQLHFTIEELVAAGLKVEQHIYTMGPGEWYCDGQGPFETLETAALAGIKRVIDSYHDFRPIWDDTSETAAQRGTHPIERREPIDEEGDDAQRTANL